MLDKHFYYKRLFDYFKYYLKNGIRLYNYCDSIKFKMYAKCIVNNINNYFTILLNSLLKV